LRIIGHLNILVLKKKLIYIIIVAV